MGDVQLADGKAELLRKAVLRVDDEKTLAKLLPKIKHQKVRDYISKMYQDEHTLVLHFGLNGCAVCSIVEHPFFGGKVGLIGWMQNPDRYPVYYIRSILRTMDYWAKDEGAHTMITMLDELSPVGRLPALERLTGLKTYRLLLAKELV